MKKCKTCYGYGLHYLGDASPVGPIDASDGYPTIPCPECGANKNPVKDEPLKENEIPLSRVVGKKLDPMTLSFMEFCESLGLQFVDVTSKCKIIPSKSHKVKSSKKNVRENKTNKS